MNIKLFRYALILFILLGFKVFSQQELLRLGKTKRVYENNRLRIPADNYFALPQHATKQILNDSTIIIGTINNWPPFNLKKIEIVDFRTSKVLKEDILKKNKKSILKNEFLNVGKKNGSLKVIDDYKENIIVFDSSENIINVYNYELGGVAKMKKEGEIGKRKRLEFSSKNDFVLLNPTDSTLRCINLINGDIISEQFYPKGVKKSQNFFAQDDSSYFNTFTINYNKKLTKNLKIASLKDDIIEEFLKIVSQQKELSLKQLQMGFLEYTTDGNDEMVKYEFLDKNPFNTENSYSNISCIVDSPKSPFRYLIYEDGTFLKFKRVNKKLFILEKKFDDLSDLRQINTQILLNEIKMGLLDFSSLTSALFFERRQSYKGIVDPSGKYLVVKNYFYNDIKNTNELYKVEEQGLSVINLETGKIMGYFNGKLTETEIKHYSSKQKNWTVINNESDFSTLSFSGDGKFLIGENCVYNFPELLKKLQK